METATKARYVTDGVHLYEVLEVIPNNGTTKGEFWWVMDCKDLTFRQMNDIEVRTCREVEPLPV